MAPSDMTWRAVSDRPCVTAAVSAECARVFLVANPDSGGGGVSNGGRDERYLWGGEGGGGGGGGVGGGGEGGGVGGDVGVGGSVGGGGESGPSRETLFASPGAGYDDGFTFEEFGLDGGVTADAVRTRRLQNVTDVRTSRDYAGHGVDGAMPVVMQSLMAAPVIPRRAAGDFEQPAVVAVVQVANKVEPDA